MGIDGSQAKTLVVVVMVLGRLAHHDTYGRCLQPVSTQHKSLRVPLAAVRTARTPVRTTRFEEHAVGRLSPAFMQRQPSPKPQLVVLAGGRAASPPPGSTSVLPAMTLDQHEHVLCVAIRCRQPTTEHAPGPANQHSVWACCPRTAALWVGSMHACSAATHHKQEVRAVSHSLCRNSCLPCSLPFEGRNVAGHTSSAAHGMHMQAK